MPAPGTHRGVRRACAASDGHHRRLLADAAPDRGGVRRKKSPGATTRPSCAARLALCGPSTPRHVLPAGSSALFATATRAGANDRQAAFRSRPADRTERGGAMNELNGYDIEDLEAGHDRDVSPRRSPKPTLSCSPAVLRRQQRHAYQRGIRGLDGLWRAHRAWLSDRQRHFGGHSRTSARAGLGLSGTENALRRAGASWRHRPCPRHGQGCRRAVGMSCWRRSAGSDNRRCAGKTSA